jgi:iron complex outermembrane receptor protein
MHKKEFLSILVTSMAIALSIPAWVDAAIASDSVEYAQNFNSAQVTRVRLNPTATGIEVILDSVGQLSPPATSVADNTLIVDIPNAGLALADGGEFQQANPTKGITFVSVTRVGNQVRVEIVGLGFYLQDQIALLDNLKLLVGGRFDFTE